MDFETTLKRHGYKLGQFIGKGSTADCFFVTTDKFPGVKFICKVIQTYTYNHKMNASKQFQEELKILSLIDHPNILRCYEFFEDKTTMFLILEYCDKGSLSKLIKKDKQFVEANFTSFAYQLSSALVSCHLHHVVHLDIKPANIFINGYNKLKLGDFGSSLHLNSLQEKTNRRAGTKAFMAPEVGLGSDYDPYKADIYSYGVTLLMAKKPFSLPARVDTFTLNKLLMDQCNDLGEIGQLIQQCISMNPEERPTALFLEEKLTGILQHEKMYKTPFKLAINHSPSKRFLLQNSAKFGRIKSQNSASSLPSLRHPTLKPISSTPATSSILYPTTFQ